MSTTDRPPGTPGTRGADPGMGRPHAPAVTLPVLVCLPTVADSPPADSAALAAMIGLVVIGRGPAAARYRVGGAATPGSCTTYRTSTPAAPS
jgi:hypothetical protein